MNLLNGTSCLTSASRRRRGNDYWWTLRFVGIFFLVGTTWQRLSEILNSTFFSSITTI